MSETTAPAKPRNEADRLESMLETLSPGDKIIVYRVVIDPNTLRETRPVKAVLREFQGVEDLDSWIYDMAAEQHWPAGEYVLDHRKQGVAGSHCRKTLSLDPPPAPASAAATQTPLELVKQAKEILGVQAQASPDSVLQSVTAALKVGAEAAGTKPQQQPQDGTLVILKPVLEALAKKLGEAPAAPPPAPDPWALLKQLKDMGLIGQPTTETGAPKPLVEQIGELKELLDVVGDLRGPAGPAVEPTAVAVAKIVAPYIPQVLHTINNVVDVVRVRFGMVGPLPTPTGPPSAPRQVGPPPLPPAMQQLIARTHAAIAQDDDDFFPVFAEGLTVHIVDGGGFLRQIQSGAIEEEQALQAVQATGLLNPAESRTRAWLLRFVHWLRTMPPLEPTPGAAPAADVGAVRARCETCGQGYGFDSVEEFQHDTRICDAVVEGGAFCKGNIVLGPEGDQA